MNKKEEHFLQLLCLYTSIAAAVFFALMALFPGARGVICFFASKTWQIRLAKWSYAGVFFCAVCAALIIVWHLSKKDNYPLHIKQTVFPCILYVFAAVNLLIIAKTLNSQSVWVDEACTLSKIHKSYIGILGILKYDVHCPLYFFITKFFVDTVHIFSKGLSDVVIAKYVTFTPTVLLVLVAATKVRKNWGALCASFFAVCVTGMPQMMRYAVEVRMYSWLMLFAALTFLFAYDCAMFCLPPPQEHTLLSDAKRERRSWILLALCAAASCYTHYFGAVSAAVIYALLLLYIVRNDKSRIKKCILSGIIAVLLFSPWLVVCVMRFINVKNTGFWSLPIGKKELLSFALYPFDYGGKMGIKFYKPFIAVYIFAAALQLLYVWQKRRAWSTVYFAAASLLVYVLTVSAGCIVSWAVRPIFVIRYALQGVPLVYLSCAMFLTVPKKIKCAPVLMCLAACGALYFNINGFARSEANIAIRYQKFLPIIKMFSKDDIIVTNHSHYGCTLDYLTHNTVKTYLAFPDDFSRNARHFTSILFPQYHLAPDYESVPYNDVKGNVYFVIQKDFAGNFEELVDKKALNVRHLGEHRLDSWYRMNIYVLEKQ